MKSTVRVACVQAEPAVLDRDGTIDKLARLTALKARYDPENLFRVNHNIPPHGGDHAPG